MSTTLAAAKVFLHHHDILSAFVHNALTAVILTLVFVPLIWCFERFWGNGTTQYRTRNFLHDFGYWAYYRLNIHYFVLEVWLVNVVRDRLSFLKFELFNHLPLAGGFVLSIVVFDFIEYWGHRWQHSNRFLWAFHSVHHTQENLSFATLVRVHPLDRVITRFYLMVPGLILGTPVMWSVFFFRQFLDALEHANLRWTYGPFYAVLVSPAFHSIHHSTATADQRSNFGVAFSVWDHIFGTASAVRHRPVEYGIPELPSGSLWNQMILPFRILRSPDGVPELKGENDNSNRAPALDTVTAR